MTALEKTPRIWGLLAQYEDPHAIYKACEKVRDAGYEKWDSCTPFPVHGLDKAMGCKPSKLPWIVLAVGLTGSTFMLWFQSFAMGNLYPMVVGGKLRLLRWLPRRSECGKPCQSCRNRCAYDAISRDGAIRYDDCFQCLDCVGIYHDPARCAPVILLQRKGRRMG